MLVTSISAFATPHLLVEVTFTETRTNGLETSPDRNRAIFVQSGKQ
jgi:hypothetical protein